MAPYVASVFAGGQLHVWAKEWEVVWSNDHPLNLDGTQDLRYSTYTGTRYTRAQLLALAEALVPAWEMATDLAQQFGPTSGTWRRGVPRVRVSIEAVGTHVALVLMDITRVSTESDVIRLRGQLVDLVAEGDARLVDVARIYHEPGLPAPTTAQLEALAAEKSERYAALREQALEQQGSQNWNAEQRAWIFRRRAQLDARAKPPRGTA